VRSPLAALGERFGRRRPADRAAAAPGGRDPLPVPANMGRGAADMQARLEEARSRLKRDIAPPPDEH
jgi:hypothetical protein